MENRLAFILGLGVLAAGAVFADANAAQPVQTTTTQQMNFAPGGTIRLNDTFGSLTVEGWDQAEVEVTVVKSLGYDSEPAQEAKQRVDAVHVATDRKSDTELAISATRPRSGVFTHLPWKSQDVTVEYSIRAPRNSHLVINHAGYVLVTGMTGNIDATDRRGDIVLMLPDLAAYSIDAHTKVGMMTSDVTATTHRKHLVGEGLSRGDAAVSHRLVLRMGFGGITIKELPSESLALAATGGE